MRVTSQRAVRKKLNVNLRYVEVTRKMPLHVCHLEQWLQNLTKDWDCPVGTVFPADPLRFAQRLHLRGITHNFAFLRCDFIILQHFLVSSS